MAQTHSGFCYDDINSTDNLQTYRGIVRRCNELLLNSHDQLSNTQLKDTYHKLEYAFAKLAQFDNAIRYHCQVLEIAVEEKDHKSKGIAHENLAFAYQNVKRFEESKTHYEEALNINKIYRDNIVERRIRKNFGKLYQKLGENKLAVKCYKEVEILLNNTEDVLCKREVYELLGEIFQLNEEYEEAIEYHNMHLDLLETHKQFFPKTRVKSYNLNARSKLGECYEKTSKYEDAIANYKEYLRLTRGSDYSHGRLQAQTNVGRCYWAIDHYEDAYKWYDAIVKACKEEGDDNVLKLVNNAHMSLGDLQVLQHNYDNAFEHYKECYSHASKFQMKESEINACSKQGIVLQSKGSYMQAFNKFDKALGEAQALENQELQDSITVHLGNLYLLQGNIEDATRYYTQIMSNDFTSNKKIKSVEVIIKYHGKQLNDAKRLQNKGEEVFSRYLLGISHQLNDNNREALELYNAVIEDIDLIRDSKSSFYHRLGSSCLSCVGSSKEVAKEVVKYFRLYFKQTNEEKTNDNNVKAYESIGDASINLGEDKKASKAYQKALKLANDKSRKKDLHWKLAKLYQSSSQHEAAIEELKKALDLTKTTLEEKEICDDLGSCYSDSGNYGEAILWYEKSLGLTEGDKDNNKRSSYAKLGETYVRLKAYIKARECYEKAFEILNKYPQTNKEEIGHTLERIAYTYRQKRKYDKAKEYYEKARLIASKINEKQWKVKTVKLTRALGDICRMTEEFEKAKEYYMCAHSIAKEIGDTVLTFEMFAAIGKCYVGLKDYMTAKTYFTTLLSKVRQSKYVCIEADVLVHLGDLYMKQGNIDKSFEHLEAFGNLKVPEQILLEITQRLAEAYKGLYESYRPDNIVLAKRKRNCFEKAKEMFERHIKIWDQEYGNVRCQTAYENNRRATQEVTSTCLQENNTTGALLACQKGRECQLREEVMKRYNCPRKDDYYFLNVVKKGDFGAVVYSFGNINCIWSLPQGEEPTSYPLQSDQKVKKEIDTFYDSFDCEDDNKKKKNEESLRQLFDILISPVIEKQTNEEIVIDAEGLINKVPFAALKDDSGNYLLNTKRIRIVPSLLTLGIIMESPQDYHNKTEALVIAAPTVKKALFDGKVISLKTLRGAVREGKTVAKMLNTKALVKEAATKETVIHEMRQRQPAIIHIAAHCKHGKIALAPSSTCQQLPNENDYILTMDEVKVIGVKAQLVVLSCCSSGKGRITKAGDFVSLSRSFIAAGARAVIVSLWEIDDETSPELMITFYEALKLGNSVGMSLQTAMKKAQGTLPKYWAPFVHVGDDFKFVFPKT